MERRKFGKSGIEVSALGYGAGHIGAESINEQEAEKILNTVVDLGISQKIKRVELSLNINNLFNEEYYEYFVKDYMGKLAFYPAPDRNVKLGLRFEF